MLWIYVLVIYIFIGMALKYIDQAYDIGAFNKNYAILISIPVGIAMGSLITLDYASSTIFISMCIGLLITRKIDNIAFGITLCIIFVFIVYAIASKNLEFSMIGAILLFISCIGDEILNDYTESKNILDHAKKPQEILMQILYFRPLMKIMVLILCIIKVFYSYVYFFAFLGFDLGYAYIEKISLKKGNKYIREKQNSGYSPWKT